MTIASEQTSGTQVDSDRMRDGYETASYAAARLLEIATRNADALVEEAREEADAIVARARVQAEELSARAEEQRVELDRAHSATLHELEERRVVLEAKVNELAEFERQYRNDVIAYLNGQLEALHARGDQAR
jgi:cell division septum initiation protein DivIVA